MLTLDELLRRRKFLLSRIRAIKLRAKKEESGSVLGGLGSWNITSDLSASINEIDFLIQYIKMKGIKGI